MSRRRTSSPRFHPGQGEHVLDEPVRVVELAQHGLHGAPPFRGILLVLEELDVPAQDGEGGADQIQVSASAKRSAN
jgi:hypothetical protein